MHRVHLLVVRWTVDMSPRGYLCTIHQTTTDHHLLRISYVYSAIKKNEIMPFAATWMDPEIVILNEVSQKEKNKYHMISLICGI